MLPRDSVPSGALGDDVDTDTQAVSQLQEFVQSFASVSPHVKVLKWTYEQSFQDDKLQFRATVSFTLGVPHHFLGWWQTSKKKAQRYTAECVRHFLTSRWENDTAAASALSSVLRELDTATWKIDTSFEGAEDAFRATLTIRLQGLTHHFCGSWCASAKVARRDTADRVLWYFGKDMGAFVSPKCTLNDLNVPLHVEKATTVEYGTEEKTLLMQVQNTLQRLFSKSTAGGQRVWVWSFECDDADPQLFLAHVEIPGLRQKFVGDWCRGKKASQRNTCLVVKSFLDSMKNQM